MLTPFALSLVETTVKIYTTVVRHRNSPRMMKNLQWLERLRLRIQSKLAQTPDSAAFEAVTAEDPGEDDVDLLGWKTRLIERAGQGSQTAKTVGTQNGRGAAILRQSESPLQGGGGMAMAQQAGPAGEDPGCGPFDFSEDALVCPHRVWEWREFADRKQMNSFWDPSILQPGVSSEGDVAASHCHRSLAHMLIDVVAQLVAESEHRLIMDAFGPEPHVRSGTGQL